MKEFLWSWEASKVDGDILQIKIIQTLKIWKCWLLFLRLCKYWSRKIKAFTIQKSTRPYLIAYPVLPATWVGNRLHWLWFEQRLMLLWLLAGCSKHGKFCSLIAALPPTRPCHPSSLTPAKAVSLIKTMWRWHLHNIKGLPLNPLIWSEKEKSKTLVWSKYRKSENSTYKANTLLTKTKISLFQYQYDITKASKYIMLPNGISH